MRHGWGAPMVLLAALACGHSGAGAPAPRTATLDTMVRGVVRVVGADPFPQVVLRPDDRGAGVGVMGALRAEIGSMDGVEIEARGPAVPNSPPIPPRAVNVREYDVVAIGGTPARSGVLTRHGGAYWLVGSRDSVELATPISEGLSAAVGHRVYVGGILESGKLREQLYGTIVQH